MEFVPEAHTLRPGILPLAFLLRPYATLLARFVEGSAIVNRFAARASGSRVTTLKYEAWDKAVEYGIVIVAVEAELEEVAAC